jgi:ribonuclease R
MLAANVATARFLDKHDLPALYRIHERPTPERLDKLRLFLNELGLAVGGGDMPTPQDYQALRETIADRPDFDIIQTVMLRSMNQAVYSPQNEGHFGLAYQAYAHFTSPIRRYPDLLVHRAIRSVIRGPRQTNTVLRVEGSPVEPPSKWCPYTFEQMLELGEHCSMTERRADEATRDVESWLKCEFMSDKLGETFEGTIASVTQFGLFVRLDEFFVEGLVHVTSLPSDYYHYEAEKHRLKGERTGTTYRLGDGLTVQVARVDMDDRKIDFGLGDEKPRPRRQPRKSRGGEEGAGAKAKAGGAKSAGNKPSNSEKPATRRGPRRTRNGPRKPSPNKG